MSAQGSLSSQSIVTMNHCHRPSRRLKAARFSLTEMTPIMSSPASSLALVNSSLKLSSPGFIDTTNLGRRPFQQC
jgi:hypothetical protein